MTDHTELLERLEIIARIEPECFIGEGNAMYEVSSKAAKAIRELMKINKTMLGDWRTSQDVFKNQIKKLKAEVAYKQGQYDAMFLTMVEAGKKMTKLEEKITELDEQVKEYDKLIYAVETKHPNESRHETALRYITEREQHTNATAMGDG